MKTVRPKTLAELREKVKKCQLFEWAAAQRFEKEGAKEMKLQRSYASLCYTDLIKDIDSVIASAKQ